MDHLYNKLLAYGKSDMLPMHMPGHKRNPAFVMENPYCFDVTEVEGTDDLHHPEGLLKTEMAKAAALFGADKTFFLVGGSTSGILTAVSACTKRNGHILMARNCHKSVYHAAYLLQLKQSYLVPEMNPATGIFAGITLEQVKKAWEENKEIDCVVITSPTYEGIVSPIREIAAFLHEKKIPLIVDEAHGAHLHFQKEAPESAVDAGADLVIQSLHKTLPALTQTGLLHMNDTGLVPVEEIIRYEQIYQSSSPSYVLMASIGQCLDFLEKEKDAFLQYSVRLQRFYDKIKGLKNLRILNREDKDPGKVVITTEKTSFSGMDIMNLLRRDFHIELEMSEPGYALAMTSVADTEESLERLAGAIMTVDREIGEVSGEVCAGTQPKLYFSVSKAITDAYTADKAEKKEVPLFRAAGHIAGEYVYLYPPGIPYLVPGEEITEEMVSLLLSLKDKGFSLRGMRDHRGEMILTAALK